ncbi:MAG: MFS transporter, partial [Holophaga sp.]|nr:MFS transporter [Holophaga sp.]
MVIILCLAFGFVMFDRFALSYLMPFVAKDLKLSNTQIGLIMSAFAFAWALSGLFSSFLSDMRGGKKKFLAFSILLFSLLSFTTGLAGGFVSLIIIRVIMGAFEGPVLPLAQSFMLAGSTPSRRGFNMGVMQTSAVGVISSMVGPVLLVAMATALTWRKTFYLTIIPGLIVLFLAAKFLKEPKLAPTEAEQKPKEKVKLSDVFRNRNIIVSLVFGPFILCWYVGLLSFAPLYLTTVKGLTPGAMSVIMSALGVGAVVWGIIVPMLSDHIGRKPIIVVFTLLSICAPLGLILVPAGNTALMALCAFVGWCGAGVYPLFMSTVPGESVNPKFVATAISSIQGFGEIIGAVVGMMVAGVMADA